MRINIWREPEPITIGEGEASFKLKLKSCTGLDRAAIWDALAARRFTEILQAATSLINGWDDVLDENGKIIPFNGTSAEGTPAVEGVFGAIPPAMLGQVVMAILAFVGIPKVDLDNLRTAFAGLAVELPPPDPTSPPAPPTAGSA